MAEIDRGEYVASFGPTTRDRIRLADTNLLIEVEEDRCGGGDEAVFGGGKSIRESMGQSRATRAEGTPDIVITGAVVLDHWGVIKADVGIRDGRITALGKAPQSVKEACCWASRSAQRATRARSLEPRAAPPSGVRRVHPSPTRHTRRCRTSRRVTRR